MSSNREPPYIVFDSKDPWDPNRVNDMQSIIRKNISDRVREGIEAIDHVSEAEVALKAKHADHAHRAESAERAEHAKKASEAECADKAHSAGKADEAEHAKCADTAKQAEMATDAKHAAEADKAKHAEETTHALKADNASDAAHAERATLADNANHADEATHATNADTAKLADDAKHATSTDSAKHADMSTKAEAADEATHAASADKSKMADTAEHATNADEAKHAERATKALDAERAQNAERANVADKADYASKAGNAVTSDSASYAATAAQADNAKAAAHALSSDSAKTADWAKDAAHATAADSATTATHAKLADEATKATSADKATKADSADKADRADSSATALKANDSELFTGKTHDQIVQEIVDAAVAAVRKADKSYRWCFKRLRLLEQNVFEHRMGRFPLVDVYQLDYFRVVSAEDDDPHLTYVNFYLYHGSEDRIRFSKQMVEIETKNEEPFKIPLEKFLGLMGIAYDDDRGIDVIETDIWNALNNRCGDDRFDDTHHTSSPWFRGCCRQSMTVGELKKRKDWGNLWVQLRPIKTINLVDTSKNTSRAKGSPSTELPVAMPTQIEVSQLNLDAIGLKLLAAPAYRSDIANPPPPDETNANDSLDWHATIESELPVLVLLKS